MIEQPRSTAIIRTAPEDSDDPNAPLMANEKAPVEHELLIVKAKPLTARFRTIIKHLSQRAGYFSRFRGLHIFLGYTMLFQLLTSVLRHVFPRGLIFRSLAHLLVSVGLCRISLLWNHIVISAPRQRSWYSRIVTRETGKKIILPAALFALAEQATILIPSAVAKGYHLRRTFFYDANNAFAHMSESQQSWTIIKLIVVAMLGLISFITIYIPAQIAFTRVQASLLSPEEESIVPFDRTFGGKVLSAVTNGQGSVAMVEAWKSFDWNSRVRIFKVYAKVFVMQCALLFLYVFVMLFELRWAVGSKEFDERVVMFTQRGNEI